MQFYRMKQVINLFKTEKVDPIVTIKFVVLLLIAPLKKKKMLLSIVNNNRISAVLT